MSIPARGDAAVRERHRNLEMVGLRAHATSVGLIQLCEELLNAGFLIPSGLDCIKDAICSELALAKRARVGERHDFDRTLRRRVDAVFPVAPGEPARDAVGSEEDFGNALDEEPVA